MIRHFLLPVTLLLAATLYPWSCRAQDPYDFKMPSSQVLGMGIDKFVALYLRKTGDGSEVGQDNAYNYYYQRELARDKVRERHLIQAQQRMVDRIRTTLGEYEDNFINLQRVAGGGGTMFTHTGARVPAYREEQIARIIILVQHPVGHASARRRVQTAENRIRRAVTRMRKNPDPADQKTMGMGGQYEPAYRDFRRSANTLVTLLAALPDDAAAVAAKYATNVLQEF